MTTPWRESSSASRMDASPGMSRCTPVKGLRILSPFTSPSYILDLYSLEQTLSEPRISLSCWFREPARRGRGAGNSGSVQRADNSMVGHPSCRKSMSKRPTIFSPYRSTSSGSDRKAPMTVASTSRLSASASSWLTHSCGTASDMRSCASDKNISHGCSPSYFRGASARSNSAPPESLAISPTELLSPPAPLSVNVRYSPASRASSRNSYIFRCVIGSPICTAWAGDSARSSSDENVAP